MWPAHATRAVSELMAVQLKTMRALETGDLAADSQLGERLKAIACAGVLHVRKIWSGRWGSNPRLSAGSI